MNAAVTGTSQAPSPTQWQIDPAHSAAHFSVRHLMISNVRGEFSKVSGNVVLDPSDFTKSTVEVIVDATITSTVDFVKSDGSRTTLPLTLLNSPRTFDIIKCRTLKCAAEWAGSICHWVGLGAWDVPVTAAF